ncbi:MAG: STAS domain-containing protein [Solirubrobacteraceae bacterium]|jgi:anti-anti-sigma factor
MAGPGGRLAAPIVMGLAESFPIESDRGPEGHRLAPAGELDIATVPLLEAAFEEIAGDDAVPVLLDLRAVTFIDSTGVQLLLRLNERCAPTQRLRIIPSVAVERLLDITGLRAQLPLSAPI